MSNTTDVNALIDSIRASQQSPIRDPLSTSLILEKAGTFVQSGSATSGLTFYDLEIGAKFLYPVLTPLRNMIPRVSGKGGTQAAWRAITAIDTTGLRFGVSPSNRGGTLATATTDYIATYKGIGVESSVDFEAQYAGQNFEDVRAVAGKVGMEALMIGEESIIVGGNTSLSLGITPTPTLAAFTGASGATLATQTLSVICVALSHDGFRRASVAGGIQSLIARTNADGTVDQVAGGAAQKSANATLAVTGPTGSVTASVALVNGALGYAWFWGAAGAEVLGAITSINSVAILATATGTQLASQLPAADWSRDSLVFDGLLYQALKPGSGATVLVQPTGTAGVGTPLTSDGAGGIVEIDQILKIMSDNLRLGPDTMWVSTQEALNISKKILQGTTSSAQRFVIDTRQNSIMGGVLVRSYFNKFGYSAGSNTPDGGEINIRIHPNMPAGTILFTTSAIPYPLAGVSNIIQIRTRQDYYQIEWPLRTRKYEYGVYADEVLQNFFPPAMAVITNIANG